MISSLPSLTKIHHLGIGHQVVTTFQRSSSLKCFKCLGYKHITLNCPTKRTMTLNSSDEVKSEHSFPPSHSREDSCQALQAYSDKKGGTN